MSMPSGPELPARGQSRHAASQREVVRALAALREETGAPDPQLARVTVLRQNLVLRLKEHRAALVRDGLAVPRSVFDELDTQARELSAATIPE